MCNKKENSKTTPSPFKEKGQEGGKKQQHSFDRDLKQPLALQYIGDTRKQTCYDSNADTGHGSFSLSGLKTLLGISSLLRATCSPDLKL